MSDRAAARPQLADGFWAKLEEWMERSKGKIRADVAHEKITAMGYAGSERTTRRAVARLKKAWHSGRRRVFRPWVPEPGMWAQYDFGDGPLIGETATVLFCLWLAWSRFRVVLPILDKTQASVWAAVDVALRRAGGVPAYPADRQREDRHGRARRRGPGPESRGGGVRPALRADGRDLRAL